tara:strand:+ start:513 stop:1172 length:660 start_codon:yes stop_codon:yes gene_type:complete
VSKISLKHSGGNVVSLNSPTSAPTSADVAFKLPNADGSAGQFMKTDGSGNLSFDAAGGGKVLNYDDATKSDTQTTLSTSFVDITGLSVTLTPASSASKFLIMYSVFAGASQNVYALHLQLVKVVGGTASDIHRGDANGNRGRFTAQHWSEYGDYDQFNSTIMAGQVIHAPSTTNAVTFKMQFRSNDANYYAFINRMEADNDSYNYGTMVSNITVMELAS